MKLLLLAAALLLSAAPVLAADCDRIPGTSMNPASAKTTIEVNGSGEVACSRSVTGSQESSDSDYVVYHFTCPTFKFTATQRSMSKLVDDMHWDYEIYGVTTRKKEDIGAYLTSVLTDKVGRSYIVQPIGAQIGNVITCATDNNSREIRKITHFSGSNVKLILDERSFWVREADSVPQI